MISSNSLPNPSWALASPKFWLPTIQPWPTPYVAKSNHFLHTEEKRGIFVHRAVQQWSTTLNFVSEPFLLAIPLNIREHK